MTEEFISIVMNMIYFGVQSRMLVTMPWCCNFHLKGIIRPATLIEISNSDLISYIDSIKEYEIENSKLININYIHLNYDFLNIHQNT